MQKEYMHREVTKLEAIASRIDYQGGFNGFLTRYRAMKLLEFCIGPSVLDLGCAEGTVTGILVDHFPRVTAVDGSLKFISAARDRLTGKPVSFVHSTFEDVEFKPQSFDTVVMSYILEHVADPVAILAKARHWLKNDGRLVVFVPNAESLHRRIGLAMGLLDRLDCLNNSDLAAGHRRVYTARLLHSHLQESGYKILWIEDFFLKPLSNSQMEGWDIRVCDSLYEVGKQLPGFCSELVSCAVAQ
jgi:2-polyprenyl-3-methyl-5-hydroxy-6-metoxy-1,4-benzoquinol methylase